MPKTEYQRLTRARNRSYLAIFSTQRSSLWLGHDHLLGVDSSGYTETYKRFYFRDIQGIQVRQSDTWKYLGLVFGILTLLFTLIALGPQDQTMALIFGPIALLFLLASVANLVSGPTCVTHLHTAVQTERLPSLNRWKKTLRVLDRIRPLIIAAQGAISPEEIPARLQSLNQPSPSAGTPAPSLTPSTYLSDDPNAPPRILA